VALALALEWGVWVDLGPWVAQGWVVEWGDLEMVWEVMEVEWGIMGMVMVDGMDAVR